MKPRPGSHGTPRTRSRTSAVTAACFAVLALVLWLAAPAAQAATPKTGDPVATDTTPLPPSVTGESGAPRATSSGAGAISRMVVGLGIVLAVIFGVYWLLKRVYGGRSSGRTGSGLEVVASVALGPNRTLQLVRVADELVLVGVAGDTVTAIRSWDAAQSRRLEAALEPGPPSPQGPSRPSGPPTAPRPSLLDEIRRRTLRP
ncbi:MAG: flagellar biosynthetic protein FliO [Gaiellales bacterium]